jgi:PHD/YefM family antitoxin component YafN of YafNO toxin-antitoxin module
MSETKNRNKIGKLKTENKSLKETIAILSNKKLLEDIKTSLDQIKQGKTYSLSKL